MQLIAATYISTCSVTTLHSNDIGRPNSSCGSAFFADMPQNYAINPQLVLIASCIDSCC